MPKATLVHIKAGRSFPWPPDGIRATSAWAVRADCIEFDVMWSKLVTYSG